MSKRARLANREARRNAPPPVELSDEAQLADRLERAMNRGEDRLRELGMLPPKRTRAERRHRAQQRRAPNDAQPGETDEQRRARRRAEARATRRQR